jgi:ribonuclease HII
MAFVLGVDENGLGPRLGPLIVTAVALEADPSVPKSERAALSRPSRRDGLADRLADSKALVRYGASSLGEAWARAIADRLGAGGSKTPDDLVHALGLDAPAELRAPCPADHERQCWGHVGEAFEASDEDVAIAHADLDRLAKKGLRVRALRTAIVCTRRLNEAAAKGVSRFLVDLHTMERLVLKLRGELGQDVYAVCGKVGGYDKYDTAFGPLSGHLRMTLAEGRKRSEYRFPGVGTLAFVRDADDSHLVVSLASLVGKWVRDLMMNRIIRYHREDVPDLPDASGYHDPTTTQFIEATALVREKRGLPDDCFERNARAIL